LTLARPLSRLAAGGLRLVIFMLHRPSRRPTRALTRKARRPE